MILISILIGIIIFILLLSGFLYFTQRDKGVSSRLEQYRRPVIKRRDDEDLDIWKRIAKLKINEKYLKILEKIIDRIPFMRKLDMELEKAAIPLSKERFLICMSVLSVLWFLFIFVLTFNIINSIFIVFFFWVMTIIYVYSVARRRIAKFNKQLPDTIVMLSNALKAGFTFVQAMSVVAKEMEAPISEEFAYTLQEIQLGVPVDIELESMSKRINNIDLDLVITAVNIQRQVGGNLSKIMDTIGGTIRERIKLKNEIKALTAEGVISGWVIGLLPIGLAGMMLFMNPNYFDGLIDSGYGIYIFIVSAISEVIGGLIIKKLINFKI